MTFANRRETDGWVLCTSAGAETVWNSHTIKMLIMDAQNALRQYLANIATPSGIRYDVMRAFVATLPMLRFLHVNRNRKAPLLQGLLSELDGDAAPATPTKAGAGTKRSRAEGGGGRSKKPKVVSFAVAQPLVPDPFVFELARMLDMPVSDKSEDAVTALKK